MFADWYFLNLSLPLYTLYIHLYTIVYCIPMYSDVFRIPLSPLSFWFLTLQKSPGIWTSAPRLANGMERFPVPHLVDFRRICQLIRLVDLLASYWGGVDNQCQKKIEDVISAQKCTAGFGVADVASNLCAGEAIQFDTQHHKRSCQRPWQGPSTYSGECSNV